MTRARKRWLFLLALLYDFVYDYYQGAPVLCALLLMGVLELVQAWWRVEFSFWPMLIFVLITAEILSEWGVKKHYQVRYVCAIRLSKCQKRWGMMLSLLLALLVLTFVVFSVSVFRRVMH